MSEANQPTVTKKVARSPFDRQIREFADSIDSLLSSLPTVMTIMKRELKGLGETLDEFVAKNSTDIPPGDDGHPRVTINGTAISKFLKLSKMYSKGLKAYHLIHRSYLISVISQYDAFLGCLLRITFLEKPALLKASNRQFSFKELVELGSIDEARDQVIEREVDDVIRKSHEDQLNWVESEFKIEARKFIREVPAFVEVAQRRHLFVHCDGKVSRQYLGKCAAAGCRIDEAVTVDTQLEVSREYLEKAFETVYAVGVKLGCALWLHVRKDQFEEADNCVNSLAFELIQNERYALAINLLDYALSSSNKRQHSETTRRFQILNLAQAHKWSGDSKAAIATLDAHDWKASSDQIRLAERVLRDDFDSACALVRKLAHDPDFNEQNYYEWPIYQNLRKQPKFIEAFVDAYKKPFEQQVTSALQLPDPEAPETPQTEG
jgi:hypothetical protein